MTQADHDRWESYYIEALERDALKRAYAEADNEYGTNPRRRNSGDAGRTDETGGKVTYRQRTIALCPQARYLNLGGTHCIDDDYNDRYLAFAAKDRASAWK